MNVQIHRVGGYKNGLVLVAFSFFLLFGVWSCLALHSDRTVTPKQTVGYEEVDVNHLHMVEADSQHHCYRMYLIGENSISFPWWIPKDFPNKALEPEHREKFLTFLRGGQQQIDWNSV